MGGIDGLLALDAGALARTPAGQHRRVVAFDDQYLLGFRHRTGALLTELVAALHPGGGPMTAESLSPGQHHTASGPAASA